ncbi:MAG: cytochrome c biogenesis protein CcsA [Acidobacteriota bacterium]
MKSDSLLGALTFITMLAAIYLVFLYAPTELTMGEVQRIFYFHVSSAWISFLAIFIVCAFSVAFLVTGSRETDIQAAAAAEVGALFCTFILITGPLWAKPVWGIWWTWDPRLTSSFVLWLIYMAYLMLRRMVEAPEQRARLSAVFGVLGAVDVPIVYMANRWWRTQHPQPVMGGGEGSGLDPQMRVAFFVSLLAFTFLFFYLWRFRCRLERSRDQLEAIQRQLQTRGAQ